MEIIFCPKNDLKNLQLDHFNKKEGQLIKKKRVCLIKKIIKKKIRFYLKISNWLGILKLMLNNQKDLVYNL